MLILPQHQNMRGCSKTRITQISFAAAFTCQALGTGGAQAQSGGAEIWSTKVYCITLDNHQDNRRRSRAQTCHWSHKMFVALAPTLVPLQCMTDSFTTSRITCWSLAPRWLPRRTSSFIPVFPCVSLLHVASSYGQSMRRRLHIITQVTKHVW